MRVLLTVAALVALLSQTALGAGLTLQAWGAYDGKEAAVDSVEAAVDVHGDTIGIGVDKDNTFNVNAAWDRPVSVVLGATVPPGADAQLYAGGRIKLAGTGPIHARFEADYYPWQHRAMGDARLGLQAGPALLSVDYAVPLTQETEANGFQGGKLRVGIGFAI